MPDYSNNSTTDLPFSTNPSNDLIGYNPSVGIAVTVSLVSVCMFLVVAVSTEYKRRKNDYTRDWLIGAAGGAILGACVYKDHFSQQLNNNHQYNAGYSETMHNDELSTDNAAWAGVTTGFALQCCLMLFTYLDSRRFTGDDKRDRNAGITRLTVSARNMASSACRSVGQFCRSFRTISIRTGAQANEPYEFDTRNEPYEDEPPPVIVTTQPVEAVRVTTAVQASSGESTTPREYICPISLRIMDDPVYDRSSGCKINFERAELEKWLAISKLHPITKETLTIGKLIPNSELKQKIEEYKAQRESQNPNTRPSI